ncbi:MAG: M28 family peptidase [Raoultibacter sp.]
MPEILDDITYLSRDIGPRPAGTEEEQQAALYITESLQKSAGFSATIEDFKCAGNNDLTMVVCFGITFVATIVSLFISAFALPAIFLTVISAVLYVLELLDKPVLSRCFLRGISQNVVAKYEPGVSAENKSVRRRKVIVLARYDSGKAMPEMVNPMVTAFPVLNRLYIIAFLLVPFVLVVRYVFFLHAVGVVALVLNILTIIALVAVAFPLVLAFIHKISAYNEAANCNASGVAVMMEVARRVGTGRISEAELAQRKESAATIHGEEAARGAGLVPEGAQLVYEAAQVRAPEPPPQTEAERLASAKAAIAALTGVPVREQPVGDIANHLVHVKEPRFSTPTREDVQARIDETREGFTNAFASPQENTSQPTEAEEFSPTERNETQASTAQSTFASSASSASSVPDWYKKAQASAKKETAKPTTQRSRYADVLDAAVAESSVHFSQAERAIDAQAEERLRNLQDDIREVKAPQAENAPHDEEPRSFVKPSSSQSLSPESTVAMKPLDANMVRSLVASPAEEDRVPVEGNSAFEQKTTPQPFVPSAVPSVFVPDAISQPDIPVMNEVANVDERSRGAELSTPTAPEVSVFAGKTQAFDPLTFSEQIEQPQIEQPSQPLASTQAQTKATRRPIVLPDVNAETTALPPISDVAKQRAPLAEAITSGKTAAKSLLAARIPEVSFDSDEPQTPEAAQVAKIRPVDLPSLSGELKAQAAPANLNETEHATVSATGSFAAIGATGSFAPVGDALVADVALEDLYIDDADDSDYDANFTESGAFTGSGYVDMPKSRARKFLDKFSFRKKNKEKETTPQEWLAVDDDFDARSAGAARGGWDSFQETAEPHPSVVPEQSWQDESDQEDFAPLPVHFPNAKKNRFDSSFDTAFSNDDEFDDEESQRWNGGAFSRGRSRHHEPNDFDIEGESEPVERNDRSAIEEEFKQIYQFRHPDIDTEVWFVSLGAELAGNAGMYAFLREHAQELKGSVFINLEALGAGTLSYLEKEGFLKQYSASSRMKRYIKKATQASGVSAATASIGWKESAASVALKHGAQAMSLVGMEGKKPAFYGQGDDVVENLDEKTLQENADFVMELLKNI